MSCCGDLGWSGYLSYAKAALAANPRAKALVLHVTPFWLPGTPQFNGRNPLAESLQTNLVSVWRFFDLPSMNFRLGLKRFIESDRSYYQAPNPFEFRPPWDKIYSSIVDSEGWRPVPWRVKIDNMKALAAQTCDFSDGLYEPILLGLARRKVIYPWLKEFGAFARSNNLKLAIVFGPVPCQRGDGRLLTEIEADIAKFQREFPEVFVPFTITNTYPPEKMVDPWHLSAEASGEYSRDLGHRLKGWLDGGPGSSGPYAIASAYGADAPQAGVAGWAEAILWPYLRATPEPTRCIVTFAAGGCPEHPTLAARREDDYEGAGTSEARCLARAREFAAYCKAREPVVATFYRGDAAVAAQSSASPE
jgi:hypothetical protein